MKAAILILIIPLMGLGVSAGDYFRTSGEVTYYIESSAEYTWYDAFVECSYRSMILYTIESQTQFDDLYQLLVSDKFTKKPPNLWIAAVGVNRKFVWIKTRRPLISPLWGLVNPDNFGNNENCVHIRENEKLLNDAGCLAKFGFICEVDNVMEIIEGSQKGRNETQIIEGKYKGLTINLNIRN